MSYIYKITNKINNKIYIGKTNHTPEERFIEHCRDFVRREKEHRPLYAAFNKYGIKNFTLETVEQCDLDKVNEREKYWIEYYGSFKNGYNATLGGDGKAYIDRDLVIKTYQEVQNCPKTAELCGIHVSSVYQILKENGIERKSSQQIAREQGSKAVMMLSSKGEELKSFSALIDAAKYVQEQRNGSLEKSILHGISSHIRDVCKGKRQTAYGYKWKWLDISG